jgi:hypothetical protein
MLKATKKKGNLRINFRCGLLMHDMIPDFDRRSVDIRKIYRANNMSGDAPAQA